MNIVPEFTQEDYNRHCLMIRRAQEFAASVLAQEQEDRRADERQAREWAATNAVIDVIRANPGITITQMVERMSYAYGRTYLHTIVRTAVDDGKLREERGGRNGSRFYLENVGVIPGSGILSEEWA